MATTCFSWTRAEGALECVESERPEGTPSLVTPDAKVHLPGFTRARAVALVQSIGKVYPEALEAAARALGAGFVDWPFDPEYGALHEKWTVGTLPAHPPRLIPTSPAPSEIRRPTDDEMQAIAARFGGMEVTAGETPTCAPPGAD